MIAQAELFPPPKANVNVTTLVELLRQRPAWHTAAELLHIFALPDLESRRRWIRSLAEAASPDVICGQCGYKHVEHATPEELHHCVAWLESQGKKMIARATAIRRRAHAVVG
ncbi:MAG: hypothetical protein ACYDH9_08055 [Limisphaerales bacterium]